MILRATSNWNILFVSGWLFFLNELQPKNSTKLINCFSLPLTLSIWQVAEHEL